MQQQRALTRTLLATLAFAALVALFLFALAPTEAAPAGEDAAVDWTVVADGLANPRHLTFGPDGALYVAEAGAGGDGACVDGPEGRVCLGDSGAVTRVEFDADWMPTSQEQIITGVVSLGAEGTGDGATGPHSVAFSGGDLYFLTGLGADPALRDPSGPLGAPAADFAQLMSTGPGDAFAPWVDVGDYETAENPDGGEVDSNPFGMTTVGDDFLITDAGGNDLLAVDGGTGAITTVAVFPDRMFEFPPGSGNMIPVQAVPTSVVVGPDGAYYVSQLTGGPFPVGGANVWRVEPGGDPEAYAEGFTNILDLAFGADGSLYVLEMFTNGMSSGDPTGAVTRIAPDGSRSVIAREGLITPTGMTIGPDHALYVSNFGTSASMGQVVRIPTALSEAEHFTAMLSGDNEVPPVVTDASGVARLHLAADGTLSWEVAVRDIEDITASHIHQGAPGENGPVIITLYNGTGTFDPDNPISGSAMLTPEQIDTLLAGDYYVNVHTTANPGGEIRGQVMVSQTTAWWAMLSGANEVPHIHSDGTGTAYFTLNAAMDTLYYRVMVNDLSGITASHIHEGAPGVNGPVIFPLYTGGDPFDENHPVSGMVMPDITQLAALVAGDYYVNVHTTFSPPGEIRGQIGWTAPRANYHALLWGGEENPAVDTDAVGVGTFALSADLSTVDFHLAVDAIDNVTAAHLHTGWPGQNGGVAHLLYGGGGSFGPGSPVNGLLPFDAQSVLDLWSGYYYTNVHSTDHPSGEIRGQTEGASLYGAELSGANEVPPNGSAGTGRAVLALSDDASTLYWRVMVSDIEHITAAHIHRGAAGENGPVVFPLFTGGPPPFDVDNPVSGSSPMTDADLFDLIAGRYYVNVHTSHLPAGEIRGQVTPQEALDHYRADLAGDQEVPPVDTDASGHGHFTLDGNRNTLHYFVEIDDIDNVTASHIHKAPVGVNGPVIFPLFLGNGLFDPDNPIGGGVALGAENLVDLLTEYYYVNVHTSDYPGGEIRGQIAAEPVMVYMPVNAAP